MSEDNSLKWSVQFTVAPSSRTLPGDKISLPPSALEQLLSVASTVTIDPLDSSGPSTSTFDPFNPYSYAAERQARAQLRNQQVQQQQQLPHPLTFRLVNPDNGRVVYAGIREFSAEEGHVVLSSFLRHALGIDDDDDHDDSVDSGVNGGEVKSMIDGAQKELPRVTVHAKQLPKGTYVRLRPLEAGYDIEDWKSLLEQHLRTNFTTLTNGEVLTVPGGNGVGSNKSGEYKFLIDKFKPLGDGICVVDTDLEVDIEPLNEEQARETLQRRLAKSEKQSGSSTGGNLELGQTQRGQIQPGEYVDYQILKWDRSKGVEVEIGGVEDDQEVDLFVSPLSARQRARPRDDEHVFGDFSSQYPKRISLQPTNVELEDAEAIWISVHGYPDPEIADQQQESPRRFYIQVSTPETETPNGVVPSSESHHQPDEIQCKNCQQFVPQRTMMLHESFCLRNNILCRQCRTVFKKNSAEWSQHWHCPHDSCHGNTAISKTKHDLIQHPAHAIPCPSCPYEAPSIPQLAHHRTTICPGKLIICQFCHLLVPQSNPTTESLLSGLTPHEYLDGSRTTECHLCSAIIRLRDMRTHLRHHDIQRRSRPRPVLCRNVNCGRTIPTSTTSQHNPPNNNNNNNNNIGLCNICFTPLYVAMYDPENKALRRRVERRYLTQLLSGCGTSWCKNVYCKTGRTHLESVVVVGDDNDNRIDTRKAAEMAKPFVERLLIGDANTESLSPLHFCVDRQSQDRRVLADLLVVSGGEDGDGDGDSGYALEWWVMALEKEGGDVDRARGWLKDWAPMRKEESVR